jgi:hypothetical protein
MSQPLSAAGYQRIRDLLQADTAIYLELLDAADAPIIRLPISDSRLSWAHEADGNEFPSDEFTGTIKRALCPFAEA